MTIKAFFERWGKMIFLLFFVLAVLTVVFAIKISNYADIISKKSVVGGTLIGSSLLGVATSLPELSTSISSIAIDDVDILMGNILGSNMFNIFILAFINLIFLKKFALSFSSKKQLYLLFLNLFLALFLFLSMTFKINLTFFHIGLESIFLLIIYIIGFKYISKIKENHKEEFLEVENEEEKKKDTRTIKTIYILFILVSLFLLGSSSVLTIVGNKIAIITGLGSTFVGSFMIALATSLPEAVSVYIAFKLRNYQLGIGSILTSNLFNIFLLIGTDFFYFKSPIISSVENGHTISVIIGIMMLVFILINFIYKKVKNVFLYALPSILIIFIYIWSTYLIL